MQWSISYEVSWQLINKEQAIGPEVVNFYMTTFQKNINEYTRCAQKELWTLNSDCAQFFFGVGNLEPHKCRKNEHIKFLIHL